MPHFLPTSHEAIERLHQFTGIEAVALAQIDEQTAIPLLGLVLQLLFVGLGEAGFTGHSGFTGFTGFFWGDRG